MSEIWQSLFEEEGRPLLYAFVFLLLAAPSFGTIGVFVSLKNYNSSIGTIAHASLLGLGIAKYTQYYWGWSWLSPFLGMLGIAVLTALLLFAVESHHTIRIGTLLNVIWSTGMALGILLLQRVPGGVNIDSYLWGSLLIIGKSYLWELAVLDIAVLLALILPWRHHQLFIFDQEFARSRGLALGIYSFIFYILVSYAITAVISAVGILLSLGLFSIPSSIANLFAKTFKQMLLLSSSILLFSSWLGLFISVEKNLSSGILIICILAIIYLVAISGKSLSRILRHADKP